MRDYSFDEVKMSHTGMLRAKERLISKARTAASKQGLIGKAEFACLVAALFLYEIWFSLVVYAHVFVKRVLPRKRITKIAVIALAVIVFSGIAAFASGSKTNSRNTAEENVEAGEEVTAEPVKETASQVENTSEEAAVEVAVEEAAPQEEIADADTEETSVQEDFSEADEKNDTTESITSGEGTVSEDATADSDEEAIDAETDSDEDDADEGSSYAEQKSENPDFYGWITSEEANINSPVMFCKSKPEKYLEKNFYGKRDKNGLPSVVDEVKGDLSSVIIYAGNADGNGKFAGLLDFEKDGQFEGQGTIRLNTLDESIEFEIVTGFAESEEAKDNEDLLHIGDNAKTGDCFLVLVTGTGDGHRYYVVAKSK